MVISIKKNCDNNEYTEFKTKLIDNGAKFKEVNFNGEKVLCFIDGSDKGNIDFQGVSCIDSVKEIAEPYKLASRSFKAEDTVIKVGDVKIGGGNFAIIGGPCAVESESQIIEIAEKIKKAGVKFLRGGAFKPRTSPYDFQGLKEDGIKYLVKAKRETGLKIVSEITSEKYLDLFSEVDVLQVGARNMQNYELLKAIGKTDKPVILKRGFSNTVEELLLSAEYVLSEGNSKVILCERGIRTFETVTRNTLDLASVAYLKHLTHLPIICDPSHASGVRSIVKQLALASASVGADGLMLEVHNNPENALCDGAQSISEDEFKNTVKCVGKILKVIK